MLGVLQLLIQTKTFKFYLHVYQWVQYHGHNKHLFQTTSIQCVKEENLYFTLTNPTHIALCKKDLVYCIILNALHNHLTMFHVRLKLRKLTKYSTGKLKGY